MWIPQRWGIWSQPFPGLGSTFHFPARFLSSEFLVSLLYSFPSQAAASLRPCPARPSTQLRFRVSSSAGAKLSAPKPLLAVSHPYKGLASENILPPNAPQGLSWMKVIPEGKLGFQFRLNIGLNTREEELICL